MPSGFGLARDYNGICHMRFDDTNPEKENQEYVDSISDMVKWLGFGWDNQGQDGKAESNLYFASDYFDFMYRAAESLIENGNAYVDEQTAEEMRINRGTFAKCATANTLMAAWYYVPKLTWPRPTSTCATLPFTAFAVPTTTTRAINGAFTPCTPLHTRLKTRLKRSPTPFAH
jgi:hypothetical protein